MTDNIKLLIKCSEYLSNNSFMSKETFKEYLEKFAEHSVSLEGNNGYYSNRLREKIFEMNSAY